MINVKYWFVIFIIFVIIPFYTCCRNTINYIDKELYYSMNFRQLIKYTRDIIAEEEINDNEGKNIPLKFRESFLSSIPFKELINEDNWQLNTKFIYIKIEKDLTMIACFKLNKIKNKIKYIKTDYDKYHGIIEYYMNKETDDKEINEICQ